MYLSNSIVSVIYQNPWTNEIWHKCFGMLCMNVPVVTVVFGCYGNLVALVAMETCNFFIVILT